MATNSPHLRASRDGQSPHYWHLAQDSTGVAMTDLEYAILRVFEAFGRWQSECLAAVSGASITGPENVLLHVVAMKGRAKTIHDVMLLTNRQDTPNVQYGLRKLMKLGFIKKRGSRAPAFSIKRPKRARRFARTTPICGRNCSSARPGTCRNSNRRAKNAVRIWRRSKKSTPSSAARRRRSFVASCCDRPGISRSAARLTLIRFKIESQFNHRANCRCKGAHFLNLVGAGAR